MGQLNKLILDKSFFIDVKSIIDEGTVVAIVIMIAMGTQQRFY